MTERYIRDDLLAVPIGGGVTLVLSKKGGPRVRLSDGVAAALMRCTGFDTLRGHAARAARELRLPEGATGVEAELARLAQLGLLRSWADLAAIGQAQPGAGRVDLRSLAILTRNRPEALARCLRSHLEHAARFGRSLEASVMDASTDADGQARTRAVAQAIAAERGATVRYASAADREAFAGRLARASGVPIDLLRFALGDAFGCGHDTGANRNALLLGLPGRAFLCSDDDVVCEPHRAGEAGDRLRLTSDYDPTKVTLFESLADARASFGPEGGDLLAAHEALLGRPIGALLAERSPDGASVEPLRPPLLLGLVEGTARVAVTSSGLVGDCGSAFPTFYLFRPEVRDRIATLPREAYQRLVESRQISRTVPAPTVTSGDFMMSTHLALDQRTSLPPFFPVLRGQDLLFARVLHLGWPAGLIGHVATAVLHRPVEERRASASRMWPTEATSPFVYILDACLLGAGEGTASAREGTPRLQLLGRHLREIGSLELPDFERVVRSRLARMASTLSSHWSEQLLALGGSPSPWSGDLARRREDLLATVSVDLPCAASELLARHGAAEGERLTRLFVQTFGELLERWPDIVAAAVALDRAGQGLFETSGSAGEAP